MRRNNVTVTGSPDGPVVVLAHGFGCDQNMWRLAVPALAADHRVVLFDYVGSGRSDLSAWSEERYSTLDGYAEDVVEVCARAGPARRGVRRALGQRDDRGTGRAEGAGAFRRVW